MVQRLFGALVSALGTMHTNQRFFNFNWDLYNGLFGIQDMNMLVSYLGQMGHFIK